MNDTMPRSSRVWEVLCHISSLSAYVGVPFGHVLGPLICWLIKRGDSPAVEVQGKESINFQLSMTLYGLAMAGFAIVLVLTIIGILLLPLLVVLGVAWMLTNIILVIVAAVKAGNGEVYRYPLTIHFLS
jgi:uncharacterized protein